MQNALKSNTSNAFKFNFSFSNENKKILMSDASFNQWRKYIYELSGIQFQNNKKYLLESRLQKRVNYLNLKSFDEYLSYLKTNPKREFEKQRLLEAITINETYFFRNQAQFDALANNVIPELLSSEKRRNKNQIRIWSAASSTGEEAYSMAMIINELVLPKYPNLRYEIVGTDINHAVVETAQNGIYKQYSVRNMPPLYLHKYLSLNNNIYQVKPELKKNVKFKVLNLYDSAAMRMMNRFDVIFCANVLIYFDDESKRKVVSNLYDALNNDGYLFIGYSESLHGISKAFKLVSFPKTIGYKKE